MQHGIAFPLCILNQRSYECGRKVLFFCKISCTTWDHFEIGRFLKGVGTSPCAGVLEVSYFKFVKIHCREVLEKSRSTLLQVSIKMKKVKALVAWLFRSLIERCWTEKWPTESLTWQMFQAGS